MKKIFFVSFSVLTFIACSHKVISKTSDSSSNGAAPAADKPKAADANALYTSNVKSIFENKCTPCHFPAQGGNKPALDTYAAASSLINECLERVQLKPDERGYMPFRGKKEGLTAAEIDALKAWKAALGK
ncbi:MAG: cytochrome c [Ferruginibacter sp.]